jgi:hypothetical protein
MFLKTLAGLRRDICCSYEAETGQERTFDNAALIVDNVISFETTDIE